MSLSSQQSRSVCSGSGRFVNQTALVIAWSCCCLRTNVTAAPCVTNSPKHWIPICGTVCGLSERADSAGVKDSSSTSNNWCWLICPRVFNFHFHGDALLCLHNDIKAAPATFTNTSMCYHDGQVLFWLLMKPIVPIFWFISCWLQRNCTHGSIEQTNCGQMGECVLRFLRRLHVW